MHVKGIVENEIAKSLSMFHFSEAMGKKRRRLDRVEEFLNLLQRDMVDKEQLRIDRARQSTQASEESLKEEGLDGEDFKATEEALAEHGTIREELQPEWDDEDECHQENDELMKPDPTTRNAFATVSQLATFDRRTADLDPNPTTSFDIDTERSDQALVHDAGPLYKRSTLSVDSVDEQQRHSASATVFQSGQPASSEELARFIAQQQQRRDQDARA